MIEVENLKKAYGAEKSVDGLSFTVKPGMVTGFLGPNGAGKSTTMRVVLGLDAPTSGTAKINGKRYTRHRAPLREIGALLEARAVHPGRSARDHLLAVGSTHGSTAKRVDEVLDIVGLTKVARKRVGNVSLGMGRRLGIGAALLGDPHTVMLDEPVNGLNPDGIKWIRTLLRDLAAEGRTVFVSSHLMSEMALTAEHLIVLGRGRLIADVSVADLIESSDHGVRVRTPRPDQLVSGLQRHGVKVTSVERGLLHVTGMTSEAIGVHSLRAGIPLFELAPQSASLEEAYTELTRDAVEYQGTTTTSFGEAA
ncbi:ATP-binding cassette domain-containing protein [Amycolatopsis sp. lyj-109]|uniref:ATP-binding cassette domain-containing protein n=1 Tax=Amycolatopsis sp. lyj-109 TaxID=2789287 RepID=UPI00397C6047